MEKNSVKKNLFYNMTYQFLILILPIITVPYISRVIGPDGVGIYSYYNSIAIYFGYFALIGISNYGNRSIAKIRDNKTKKDSTFSSIYGLQFIISVIVLLLYIFFSFFIVKENNLIPCIMTLYVLSMVFNVSWFFFGIENFKITAVRQIGIRILTLIMIFGFVKNKQDLWIYTLIMSLSYLISSLYLWILVWKKVNWVTPSFKDILIHLKPCLLLFIPIIATSVYRQMDKIMVGSICNMKDVGYYENAEKLITISLGLISSFSDVIMPKISNLISNNNYKEANKLFDVSMEFAMCIGIAIGFGIASISDKFIPLFFGNSFKNSIKLSKFLSISVPFICWSCIIRVLYLIPYEKDKIYIKSVIIGALFNLICNLLLIPKIGVMGAVIGTLIAESSVAIYQTIKIRKNIKVKKYVKESIIFLLFGICMYSIVKFIGMYVESNILGITIQIIIGVIIYMSLSLVYLLYSKNSIILNIFKKFGINFEK